MSVDEILAEVVALLQKEGRISYRLLKRRFALDDDYLEDLKAELIDAKRLAADEDGKVLVWVGDDSPESRGQGLASEQIQGTKPILPAPMLQAQVSLVEGSKVRNQEAQPPSSYTPPHLAERIRAEQAALEARSGTDGERKTITALFADLKGSTALIEGLDPEEARAIIDPA